MSTALVGEQQAHARSIVDRIQKNGGDTMAALGELVAQVVVLHTKLTAAETRLKALEDRPKSAGVSWAGIYVVNRRYLEGSLCTRSGSLWLAKNSTVEQPGNSPSWTLVCKSGQVPER